MFAWRSMSHSPTPPARTLCCPVCGREMGVGPREHGQPWTKQQTWLVMKLDSLGAGRKFIARVVGGTPEAVYEHVWNRRGAA